MIRMGLIGDLRGDLAQDLAESVGLAAYDASLAGIDGVVVDGQSADGTKTRAPTISSILQSGRRLALVNPTPQLLSEVHLVTGCGPSEMTGVVTFAPTPGGRSRYRCTMTPSHSLTSRSFSSDGGRGPVTTDSQKLRIGPILARSLGESLAVRDSLAVGDAGENTTLEPPVGATYGYSSFEVQFSPVSFGGPTINSKPDDKTAQSNSQSQSGYGLTEFFVYYVDGYAPPNGTTPAYYIVILRQTGSFSCGQSQLAQNENSCGWFQCQAQIGPNTVTQQNQQPFPSGGVTLIARTPSASTGGAFVKLSEQMNLMAAVSSGTGTVQFTAQVSDTTQLEGWAVADTSTGLNTTSWNYYQQQGWDPTQKNPDDFGSWFQSVFPSHDQLIQFPALSCAPNNLNFETLTTWSFGSSLLASGSRSLFVQFRGNWSQDLAFLHNYAGCLGAAGSNHHHLFDASASWPWDWLIDLGEVAQPQRPQGG